MNDLKSKADTGGYAKAKFVKAGNGNLKTLRVHNAGGSAVYLQFHDTGTAPAEGAVPGAPPIPLASGNYYESDTPFDFVAGLYVCASSTSGTKTLIAGNDVWITAEYY